jgi:hypothetical protein
MERSTKLQEVDPLMNRWINTYGTVAVLLMLLLVMNPEVRAFLLLADFIGLDLMIFFIVIQMRELLPAIPSYRYQLGRSQCLVGYTALRVTTRTIGLFGVCPRVGGLDHITFHFVEEHVVSEAKTGASTGALKVVRHEGCTDLDGLALDTLEELGPFVSGRGGKTSSTAWCWRPGTNARVGQRGLELGARLYQLSPESLRKRLCRNIGHSHDIWIRTGLETTEPKFEAARARSPSRHQATRWQSVTPIE